MIYVFLNLQYNDHKIMYLIFLLLNIPNRRNQLIHVKYHFFYTSSHNMQAGLLE